MLTTDPEPKAKSAYKPARRRSCPSLQLTERDLEVLRFFSAIRFAETAHFAAALVPQIFPTEEKLLRRLRKLARDGYLDLPARRIASARESQFVLSDGTRSRGRPEHIWALAQRGADLLKLKGDWNRNNGRLQPTSFQHPLMITRVYTALQLAAAKGLIQIDQWAGENNWRGRITVNGESLPLVPDAVFLISDKRTGREVTAFLETDNNTEPLRRSTMVQSSFFKKCAALLAVLGGRTETDGRADARLHGGEDPRTRRSAATHGANDRWGRPRLKSFLVHE